MQLRNKTAVLIPGISTWPPNWSRIFGEGPFPVGLEGIVEEVHHSTVTEITCILIVRHGQGRYLTSLRFEDKKSCESFCEFLNRFRGRSITEMPNLNTENRK